MNTRHIVLAGDSIFDNDGYVIGESGVIEQLRASVPSGWSASKVAVDGDCIHHVAGQIENLPSNATDLIVSVGGNDVRQYSKLLDDLQSGRNMNDLLGGPLADFRRAYRDMLEVINKTKLSIHVCTIYTAVPFTDPVWRQYVPNVLRRFNNVIVEEAGRDNIPVLRLETVCVLDSDFAECSPIEPSSQGGQKIVDHIIEKLQQ